MPEALGMEEGWNSCHSQEHRESRRLICQLVPSVVGTEYGGGLMREGLMRAAAQANALSQWLCWAVQ